MNLLYTTAIDERFKLISVKYYEIEKGTITVSHINIIEIDAVLRNIISECILESSAERFVSTITRYSIDRILQKINQNLFVTFKRITLPSYESIYSQLLTVSNEACVQVCTKLIHQVILSTRICNL